MSHQKSNEEKQFDKDLKANESASDKLDKELNSDELFSSKVENKEEVKEEAEPPSKSPKQLILEECGGLESNVPINSPYWNMKE